MECEGLVGRGSNLLEERRWIERLEMGFGYVWNELMSESLSAWSRLDCWSSFAKCKQDLEFSDGLDKSM